MKRTILSVTVVVVSIAVFSFYFARPEDLGFAGKTIKQQKITLDKSIKVLNFTNNTKSDTTINIICQILKVKNVTIIVVPIVNEEEKQMLGYIQKRGDIYLMRIQDNLTDDLLLETFAHELVHLYQFESGDLERLSYGIRYKEFTYSWESKYWDRKFEKEAFENEFRLKNEYYTKMKSH